MFLCFFLCAKESKIKRFVLCARALAFAAFHHRDERMNKTCFISLRQRMNEIHRIKRCKRVVVELEGIASVAIAFVPSVLLKEIEN